MTMLMPKQKATLATLLTIALCVTLSFLCPLQAQKTGSPSGAATALPRLVRFNGTAKDLNGNAVAGVVGITFALYSEQNGGAPLWVETQNIQADANGHYTVLLGASKPDGLPTDLFTSEQARWVGVQISGQTEQPRVLLVSAPYALKAGDSETVGGLPASAFALANSAQTKSDATGASSPTLKDARSQGSQANADVTGKGTIGYVPMWDTASDIVDSLIFQKSSAIGIGTKTPAATLDVSGKSDIRDTLTLFPKGKDSALTINGTAFKIDQTGTVTFVSGQTFPGGGGGGTVTSVGSGAGLTGGPITKSGTLSIATAGVTNAMLQNSTLKLTPGGGMTGGGSVALGGSTTLGLQNCSANQVLEFVGSAWTCASVGTGTITGVTAGTDLTGGGTSGKVTLNLDTTKVPQLGVSNTFTGLQNFGGTISVVSSTDAVLATTTANTAVTGESPNLGIVGASSGFSNTGAGRGNAGVWGDTGAGANSGHAGVLGTADANTAGWFINNGPFATVLASNSSPDVKGAFGVAALSNYVGVYGVLSSASATGATVPTAGVWGDTGITGDSVGVIGSADTATGGLFVNNSTNSSTLVAVNFTGSSSPVFSAVGETATGVSGSCSIGGSGDLFCSGSKSAVVPVDGGSRIVALYAIEGPENWFEDAGSAQLSNGASIVNLEPIFGQTVNTEMDYHVFLTPEGDCKGLYVSQKSPTSFEVRELGGGTSSVAFDYRIMAKRKGYENIRLADKTKQTIDIRTQAEGMRHPSKPSALPIARPAAPLSRPQAITQQLIARPR